MTRKHGLIVLLILSLACTVDAQVTLLFPDDGEELTDIAVSFKAKIISSGPYYLYVSPTPDFSGEVIRRPAQTGKGEVQYNTQYFLTYQGKVTPNDRFVLDAGVWFWRVSGDGGKTFSETRTLNVTDEKPLTPAEWDISPEKPFFHMRMRSDLVDNAPNGDIAGQLKKIIPDHLKEFIVLDIGQSFHWLPNERSLYEYCKIFDDLGYNYVFDLGSHAWLGRIASLGEMEKVFRDLDHCVGGSLAEVFYYIYNEEAERSMIDGALELCRKYGKKLLHSDMNWKWSKWPYFNYLYYDIFKERHYADYYLPQFKTTSPWGTYTNISALQGMKLSGMVNDIGIWSDWWTWEKFGQVNGIALETFLDGSHDTDNEKTYPFMQNIKNYIWGITFGSTTFALESNLQWHWQTVEPNDHYFRYLRPFIDAVVSEKLIPSEVAIKKNFKVIVDTEFASEDISTTPPLTYVKGNVWGDMLRSTYGISDIDSYHLTAEAGGVEIILASYAEMIPNTDRYPSGIPFLPKPGIEAPKVGGEPLDVVSFYDLNTNYEANQNLNKYYPESTNEAYAQRIDSSIFVFNTFENHDIRQSYSMGIHYAGIDSLMGDIDLMSYVVGRCRRDGKTIFFQTNAYVRNSATWNSNGGKYELPAYPTKLNFKCQLKPTFASDKMSAIKQQHWDAENGIFSLEIDHSTAGAVNFTLTGNPDIVYEADSISLNTQSLDLKVGDRFQLDGKVFPESLKGIGLLWRSLNPNVAEVSAKGKVHAKLKGEVALIASIGSVTDTVFVSISNVKVQSVDVTPERISLFIDEEDELSVNVEPDDASDTSVIWFSRDVNIATIKQSGKVTGVGEGEVYLIAKNMDTDIRDSCLVKVTARRVTEIILNADTLTLFVGKAGSLTAEALPQDAHFNTIDWASDPEGIVTLTRYGNFRAVDIGKVVIYAYNEYSGVKDSCLIIVKPILATELSIYTSNTTHKPGDIFRFFSSIKPSNTTDKTIVWESEDTDILTVTNDAYAKAIAEGSTYIVAHNHASGLVDSLMVSVDISADMGIIGIDDFTISPNPVKKDNAISISSKYPTTVTFYDSLGKMCFKTDVDQVPSAISTKGLQEGIYFITIDNHSSTQVKKVIIKNN